MQKTIGYETGYEALLAYFREVQMQSPTGVSLKRNRQTVNLQFKVGNAPRKPYGCNCTFTYDGIAQSLAKAKLVANKLKKVESESDFWEWYDKEVREKNQIDDDLLTVGEAIKVVENSFWSGYRKSKKGKQKRDRENPSDIDSWNDTYWRFYKELPMDAPMTLVCVKQAISRREQGTKTCRGSVFALKRLGRVSRNKKIVDYLDSLEITQTVFMDLQEIDLSVYLPWRDAVLGITTVLHKNANLETRRRWVWVFSVQLVYGLRISEVFAIQNLDKPFVAKDKTSIEALNDPSNTDNLLVIGDYTYLGTTTKTGYRLARPLIPPEYPDLLERLDIKHGTIPENKPRKGTSPKGIRNFYNRTARGYLVDWNAPFTQTHASRGLANLNGMQAGISQEVRSQSLGHTPDQNDRGYKKRKTTKTEINLLLNSSKQAIDFVSALNVAKDAIKLYPDSFDAIVMLLARIYQKDSIEITKLFEQ